VSEELFRYSTESMTWTKLDTAAGVTGTGPSARGGHSMTSVMEKRAARAGSSSIGINIYLFGGQTGSGERITEVGWWREEVGVGGARCVAGAYPRGPLVLTVCHV